MELLAVKLEKKQNGIIEVYAEIFFLGSVHSSGHSLPSISPGWRVRTRLSLRGASYPPQGAFRDYSAAPDVSK